MDQFNRFNQLKNRLETDITPQCAQAMRNISHVSNADSVAEIDRLADIVLNEILLPLEQMSGPSSTVPLVERRMFKRSVRGLHDFLEHMTMKLLWSSLESVRAEDLELGLNTDTGDVAGEDADAADADKMDRMKRWTFLLDVEPEPSTPKVPGAWPED